MSESEVQRDSGSFRDPDGFVVHLNERVFRVLTENGQSIWRKLHESNAWQDLSDLIVKTQELPTDAPEHDAIKEAYPEAAVILEHDAIPMISYPAEWTPSQLIDAGLHTLKVQLALHKHGLALKDASAYNIQFIGSKPVFIDITSVETPTRVDIWHALGQFQRHFLYPALMYLRRGLDSRGMFLTQMDGITPTQAAKMLGRFGWLRPSQLLDVYLPHWLSRKGDSSAAKTSDKKGNPEILKITLGRLASKLKKIRRKIGGDSHWVEYIETCTYSDDERRTKHEFIKNFAEKHKPKRATDFGSNTGEYSRLLADAGAYVLAVEGDLDTADALFRNCVDSKYAHSIQVICTDLANPTPAYGHNSRERQSFFNRHKADTALALALIHHLQSSSRLDYDDIASLFSRLTSRHLVMEWLGPEDKMFSGLIRQMDLETTGITQEKFSEALHACFQHSHEIVQTKDHRVVYHFSADVQTEDQGRD
ncbi:MAG: hypothetical protein ACYTDT_11670 [Planctomycetota bacterium]|jgi:hypothetical protein